MTLQDVVADRYSLDTDGSGEAALRRRLATDQKLGRRVVLWSVDDAEPAPERAELLDLARRCSRLAHPLFLKVLDVSVRPERLAVALQAPGDSSLEAPNATLPSLVAVSIMLELTAALHDAEQRGLAPRRLPLRYVHFDKEGVRVDPIGIFAPEDPDDAPHAVTQLCDLFDALLPAADAPSASFDPGRSAVRSFVLRWREREHDLPPDALTTFVSELRAILARREGRDQHEPPRERANGEGGAPRVDDSPTMTLRRPRESTRRSGAEAVGSGSAAGARRAQSRRGGMFATLSAALWPRRESVHHDAAEVAAAGEPAPPRRGRAGRSRMPLLAAAATVLVGGLLLFAFWYPRDGGSSTSGSAPTATPAAVASAPAHVPNRVTIGLQAQEPSQVRVTVDGKVAFDGVMQPGQQGSWQGAQRVQIATNKGRTLLIAINGKQLTPFSPAMGHPDWNSIDWAFGPGPDVAPVPAKQRGHDN